ncbi:hypothetical protein NFI96_028252 [Prochilodus magdalenae]|nr:hypothetical protein NFI96_028252 [Prochilodus magdalenae]
MDIRKRTRLSTRWPDPGRAHQTLSLAIRLDQLKNGANPAPRKSPVYRAPQLPLTPSPLPPLAHDLRPSSALRSPMAGRYITPIPRNSGTSGEFANPGVLWQMASVLHGVGL